MVMKGVFYDLSSSTKRVFKSDVPDVGKPQENEVVVKTEAVGLNPVDYKLADTLPGFMMKNKIVGLDIAGVVTAVGPGVTEFKVGDRVFGNKSGTLVEHAICEVKKITKIPDQLSFAQAGSMGVVYLTAYQALVEHGFEEGMKIVVVGASGGTGIACVQLAKAMKAGEIIGVCSGKNKDFVLGLGANRVIDYTKENMVEVLGENSVDYLIDCATGSGGGEDYYKAGKKVLKSGPKKGQGMFVALNSNSFVKDLLAQKLGLKSIGLSSKKYFLILAKHNGSHLKAVADFMTRDNFEPLVEKTFPFTEEGVNQGYEQLKSRRTVGKVVVEFQTPSTNETTETALTE